MGYYIQVPEHKGKAQQIADLYGGMILLNCPNSFNQVPEGKAFICVVDNGPFEAAAFCYSKREFEEFSSPDSMTRPSRPRTWLIMDWDKACELTGYKE